MQKVERRDNWNRYSDIACWITNSEIRLAYEGLARQALLYAAKFDPADVARATEIACRSQLAGPDGTACQRVTVGGGY
jgi:hypothetical protein